MQLKVAYTDANLQSVNEYFESRTWLYQHKYDKKPAVRACKQQPAFKEKQRDRQKNKIANKNQKLAEETEKNTTIFNKYKTGQNENLCFDSRKNTLAAAISTGETVCIFNMLTSFFYLV